MSSDNNLLVRIAERLGIQDEAILKKTSEFIRVLHNKGTIKNLSDIARTVLCLDLATVHLGEAFDKETAIKLSGLKKNIYQNNHNIIEKILDLNRQLTVSELCVQLSCTVVKEIAEEILTKYGSNDNKIKDLTHPQYVAAAVYTACKLKNINTSKSQFVAISRLKPMQWKELINEFEKFVEILGMTNSKRKKKGEDKKNDLEDINKELETKVVIKKKEMDDEVEDYEIWKERILQTARKALKL